MRVAVFAVLCGFLLVGAPTNGSEAMRMSVSPAQSMAPANLHIRVSIEPNAENRSVLVSAESDDFYRSSEVALEGNRGPRTVLVDFRSIPGGHYEIRGTVADSRGRQVASARQDVFVMPGGSDR